MHRIDTPTVQPDKFGQGKPGFTNGDPTTGTRATDLNSDFFDALQEELCTVIEKTGTRLNKHEHTQLYQAIQTCAENAANRKLSKKKNGKDILDKAQFIENLGLTETVELAKEAIPYHRKINGKSLTQDVQLTATDVNAVTPQILRLEVPVGVPLPWPTDRPPTGWRLCNGDRFDKTHYPLLALAYPSGQLPDLRGEFIRGADAGRKVDTGRKVLSTQGDAIRNITGQFGYVRQGQWGPWVTATGAFYQTSNSVRPSKEATLITGAPSLRLMPPGLSPPPTKTGPVISHSTTLFEALELDASVEYPASPGKPLAPKAGEIAWPDRPEWGAISSVE